MKKILVIANWKENLTATQAQKWVEVFGSQISNLRSRIDVVICPSFVLIPTLRPSSIFHLPSLHLGAQDVSKFEEGQYTGEVSAKMLKDFVDHVIVGHSERRRHFHETDEDVNRKIEQCLKYDLTPIVCISSVEKELSSLPSELSSGSTIFAYEPLAAIGSGEPDTPENANLVAQKIKTEVGQNAKILYGGSVDAKNAKEFVSQPNIDGVLVGQASLDAGEFAEIIDTLGLSRV